MEPDERVYHQVGEAICQRLRVRSEPASAIRPGLRVVWLGDGASCIKLADKIQGFWSSRDACTLAWNRWWNDAQDSLPPCRRPQPPRPVLINSENVIVAILSDEALRP